MNKACLMRRIAAHLHADSISYSKFHHSNILFRCSSLSAAWQQQTKPKPQYDISDTKSDGSSSSSEHDDLSETSLCKTLADGIAVPSSLYVPEFPDVIHKKEASVSYWETPNGMIRKDKILTSLGRVLRLFVTIERYDNAWEDSLFFRKKLKDRLNETDEVLLKKHGPEYNVAQTALKLGGAFKLVTDDRWIEDAKLIRAPRRKDFTVEGLDFRGTQLNYVGMKSLQNLGYVRYVNVGDCPNFDNFCITGLNNIADTLEYLDLSGTNVNIEGLTYLRLFPKLRWINLSRTPDDKNIKELLPYLLEVLPAGCVVVVNDDLPALSYGTPIPFRHPRDYSKDYVFAENPGLGDMTIFNKVYGENALKLYDVTHVHQLWKTPLLSKTREKVLKAKKFGSRRQITTTLVKYIKRAEKYKPLL